jgi:hypothetical protein
MQTVRKESRLIAVNRDNHVVLAACRCYQANTEGLVVRSSRRPFEPGNKAQSNFQPTDSVQGIDRRRLPFGGRVCLRMPGNLLATTILHQHSVVFAKRYNACSRLCRG